MSSTERWITLFSTELERRDLSDDRIREEVSTVRSHLREDHEDPDVAFGDPVAYAARLAAASDDATPSRSTLLALFAAIAFFIVFVLSTVQWIEGDPSASPWSIVGGIALLVSVATLSASLSRRAIESALRDSLTQESAASWKLSSTLLLLVPWTFIGFAGIVLAIAALT